MSWSYEMEPVVVVVLLGCSGLLAVIIAGRLKQLHAPGDVYAAFSERLKGTVLEKRARGCCSCFIANLAASSGRIKTQ